MNLFNKLTMIGFAALVIANPVQGQEGVRADRILSARDLHKHCAASEATEAGRLSVGNCLGALTGIADAAMTLNAALSGRQTICLEADDASEKMRLHFLYFAERRPDALELPAATVVISVLQSNFGCDQAK
ncbi:MAG: Rap1a/Tai family immunity protein [Erythrobacter sp.]